MMNHKEINKKIARLLDLPQLYDVRHQLRIVQPGVSRIEAELYLSRYMDEYCADNAAHYTITTAEPEAYCSDINHALYAARRIAERNRYTFVLSYEDSQWRAAFGDYRDCAEEVGSNPAYIICMSILKFMGKI